MSLEMPKARLVAAAIAVAVSLATGSSVSAQDNSICGWIENNSSTGALAPTMTVQETNAVIDLVLLASEPSSKLMKLGLPGYFIVYDPLFDYPGSMASFSRIKKTSSCEPSQQKSLLDNARFVADVTVSAGTPFAPNTGFTKTWRVQNTGKTSWTTSYGVAYVSGDKLGAAAFTNLRYPAKPGSVVDVAVKLTAPAKPGKYSAAFQLRNTAGQLFGPTITVEIQVSEKTTLRYFALGDSIASGHGLMDSGGKCRRSTDAYPWQVARLLHDQYSEVLITHLACSGAKAIFDANEVKKSRYKWLHHQVQYVLDNLTDEPTLVTITIGANDFNWLDYRNLILRLNQDTASYLNWVMDTKAQVGEELRRDVKKLLEKENVTVVLTSIHNPANKESFVFMLAPNRSDRACGLLFDIQSCYEKFQSGVQQLNTAYMSDVYVPLGRHDRLRVTRNMELIFAGHEAPKGKCGEAETISDTWVQNVGDHDSNSHLSKEVKGFLDISPETAGDCFHPNEEGAKAYAEEVVRAFLRQR